MSGKVILALLVVAAIIVSMSIFTVDERERALNLQLGEVVRADYEPGLHFKKPLIQDVIKFDSRILNLDSDPELYLTLEKKNVKVDSFVKWRITDVVQFYTSTGGSPGRASNRLSAVIQKSLKDEFGKRTIQQVISGERTEIMDKLRLSAKQQADELGIEIIDVRIKRIDLPEEVSASVYARMAAEREQVAKKFRSEGEEQGKRIRAEADREEAVIIAEAERDAQKLKGDGDGRSLGAYRNTFNNPSDVLLVEPNTQFFKYFKGAEGAE